MDFLISDAFAQAGGEAGGSLFSLLPLVVIFVLFYFLLIRPQQKRAKQHKEMVAALSKGEEVVTNGGLLGKVTDVDDNFISLEISSGLTVKGQRQAVSQVMHVVSRVMSQMAAQTISQSNTQLISYLYIYILFDKQSQEQSYS